MEQGGGRCHHCGQSVVVQHWPIKSQSDRNTALSELTAGYHAPGISLVCSSCGRMGGASAWHLTLDTLAAMRFWRLHPRMRTSPVRELEFEGRSALLSGF